jgi:rubredoxin/uncharacterized membrane protein
MEKTWRCTVCGYLHTGENPPDFCPVCGVDASKFELIGPAETAELPALKSRSEQLKEKALRLFDEIKASFVPHAVAAHFPNALLPTCFLFLLLTIFTGRESFENTTFYLLLIAFLATPPTFATGMIDWKTKYAGELVPIFRKKIVLGILLFVLGFIATAWRWNNPEVLSAGGFPACAYSLLILAMLGCVTLLGHYGGMLLFAKIRK